MLSHRSQTGGISSKGPVGPSQRQLRVAEEIRFTLSNLFIRGEFSDPQLTQYPLTFTRITMSPDLKSAKIYFIPLGATLSDQEMKDFVKILNQNSPEIRHLLAQKINLRFSPTLKFFNDDTFEQAQRIDDLFYKITNRDSQSIS